MALGDRIFDMNMDVLRNPSLRHDVGIKAIRTAVLALRFRGSHIDGVLGIGSFWSNGLTNRMGTGHDMDVLVLIDESVKNEETLRQNFVEATRFVLGIMGLGGLRIDCGILGESWDDSFDPMMPMVVRSAVVLWGRKPSWGQD